MGTLFVVSTPIGNLEDITIRALKTLAAADTIVCEDTRRTGLLLDQLRKRYALLFSGIAPRRVQLKSFSDEVEDQRLPEVIHLLEQDKNIALVSDAGTPLVSDPGFGLVREALRRKIKVISIPGPSALLAALTGSGLPSDKFFFLGYPPEKTTHRLILFRNLLQVNRLIDTTYIMYCAPHKLLQTLKDMQDVFSDVTICVGRELTKVYEETWQGRLSEAGVHFRKPQGEFVVLWPSRSR